MADLTTLEEKLAEVTGLAAAAVDATKKVEGLLEDDQSEIAQALQKMREESDELDGFEFLTMTEAGEVGHWKILGKVNEKAGEEKLREVVDWALPIQERHEGEVREIALGLAAEEDPDEE